MSKLDFLSPQGETAAVAPDVVLEPVAEPAPAQASEPAPAPESATQERGPDGKFLPKATAQPEQQPAAEAPTAPVAQAAPAAAPQAPAIAPAAEPPAVDPVVAELQKQVAGLTKALTATRQDKRQAPAEPAPDPYEDFEAYQQHQEHQRALERAHWSRKLAEARTDPDTVAKAHDWAAARADADPIFAQRAWQSPDPYGFALEEYQRDQALTLLSDPKLLEQFRAFQAGHGPALAPPVPAPAPAAAAPPPPAPEPPPRSLASAPSAGGPASTPVGPGQSYDRMFRR